MNEFFKPTKISVAVMVVLYVLNFGIYAWATAEGKDNVGGITGWLLGGWLLPLIGSDAFAPTKAIFAFAISIFLYYLVGAIISYIFTKRKS